MEPFGIRGLIIITFGFEFEIVLSVPVPTPGNMCGHLKGQLDDIEFGAHAFFNMQSGEFSVGITLPKFSLFYVIDLFLGMLPESWGEIKIVTQ